MIDFDQMSPEQKRKEKEALAKRIGQRLKEARQARGISQEELSARADYYRTYVGRIENGAIATSAHTIWRLAKAMDVDLGDLLKGL